MIARKQQVSSQNIYPDMGDRIAKLSLWAFGAAIVLQFIMPFVYPIVGHDAAVHLNWLEQFPRLFREGNLYPRWMPDSFWGFGSPAFYFYPPLVYWCAGLFSFIIPNSPYALYQMVGLTATIASVMTCYWYLRSLFDSKISSFMGALVYGIFPYRLIDLYLRNALGEHLAFVFLPLILLGIENALHCSTKKKIIVTIVISIIGWAGILLSNIPASVIALYTIPIYALTRVRENKLYKTLVPPLAGALIGSMIAAIYLMPITVYMKSIKRSHFWDLSIMPGNTGYSVIDIFRGDYRYFYLGLVLSLLMGIWLLFRFFKEQKASGNKNIFTVYYLTLLIATALQFPYLLKPLWNILPLFSLIQFNYRWDSLIVLSAAVFVAYSYQRAPKETSVLWFITLSSAITIVIAFGYFTTMDGVHLHYKPNDTHDVPEYVPISADGNFERARDAYKEHALDDLISSPDSSFLVHIFSVMPAAIKFSVDGSNSPHHVIFHRMYFPAWKLRNEKGTDITLTSDSLGRINAVLPASGGEYSLRLEESNEEKIGGMISLAGISLLGLGILLIIFWRNPKAS